MIPGNWPYQHYMRDYVEDFKGTGGRERDNRRRVA
jgi:hypothetical protein